MYVIVYLSLQAPSIHVGILVSSKKIGTPASGLGSGLRMEGSGLNVGKKTLNRKNLAEYLKISRELLEIRSTLGSAASRGSNFF